MLLIVSFGVGQKLNSQPSAKIILFPKSNVCSICVTSTMVYTPLKITKI